MRYRLLLKLLREHPELIEAGGDTETPADPTFTSCRLTVAGEREALARWCDHLGHVRIDQIGTPLIANYIDKRLKGGKFNGRKLPAVSERTANLDMIRLRNVLKSAIDDGYIRELPRIKMLHEAPPPKRDLVTPMQFDRVAANAYVLSFKSFGASA